MRKQEPDGSERGGARAGGGRADAPGRGRVGQDAGGAAGWGHARPPSGACTAPYGAGCRHPPATQRGPSLTQSPFSPLGPGAPAGPGAPTSPWGDGTRDERHTGAPTGSPSGSPGAAGSVAVGCMLRPHLPPQGAQTRRVPRPPHGRSWRCEPPKQRHPGPSPGSCGASPLCPGPPTRYPTPLSCLSALQPVSPGDRALAFTAMSPHPEGALAPRRHQARLLTWPERYQGARGPWEPQLHPQSLHRSSWTV